MHLNTLYKKWNHIYNTNDLEQFINRCNSIVEVKQFMLELCVAYNKEEVQQSSQYSRLVRDVMDYIGTHCSKVDLDLREIADHIYLSTARLSMLFKQETGMTIKQYIGDYRMNLAKRLISNEYITTCRNDSYK